MSSRADKIFSNNLNISDYDSDLWCAIEKEANSEVEILNNKVNEIPKVLPSLGINLIYRF